MSTTLSVQWIAPWIWALKPFSDKIYNYYYSEFVRAPPSSCCGAQGKRRRWTMKVYYYELSTQTRGRRPQAIEFVDPNPTHTNTLEAFSLSHASAVDQFFTQRTTNHFSFVVAYFQFNFLFIVSRFEGNFPPSTSDELQPMTKVNYIRLTGFSSFSFLEKANGKK